jgi:hypothetical protein
MNLRPAVLHWKSIWIPTVLFLSCGASFSRADESGQKAVAETLQSLRKAGFKTDLADFDLSTSPELRAREAILKESLVGPAPAMTNVVSSGSRRNGGHPASQPRVMPLNVSPPDLMETVESSAAAVVWKLASPGRLLRHGPGRVPLFSWDNYRETLEAKGPRLDRATAAIMGGPIRFDLSRYRNGSFLATPPLYQIKYLTLFLDSRMLLDLRDGNLAAAWTNLLAATRLMTAWEPAPPQKLHLARFANAELAFDATWQALQTNGWSDAQLARLQTEWESVDFFTRLPETAAYQRASEAAVSERDRLLPKLDLPFGEFMAWALRFPVMVWQGLNAAWWHEQYLQHESYVDEVAMLLHYRYAEVELRHAVRAPTWSDMVRIPGVAHPHPFNSLVMNNKDLLGHAAVAEARRRIVIAALALERYHARNGKYPLALSELAPDFLKKPPVDFMDGQPLRYRLTGDGHFIIYSVGLDGVDDGGRLPPRRRTGLFANNLDRLSTSAIVWPLPASFAMVEAVRRDEPR